MFGLGFAEILVILVIALVFIGPKRLPGLARTLGKGLREFQNATRGIMEQIENPNTENHSHTMNHPPHEDDHAHAETSSNEEILEAEVVHKDSQNSNETPDSKVNKDDEGQHS